ncbi:MAG: Crp/Fnr family transcriptional regulator [Arcobacteraceae bacterium]
MYNILKNCFLFQTLNNTQIEELASICTIEKYNKNNILFFEGDASTYLHILLSGNIEVYKTDKIGNKTILHYFKGESLIAEMANFYHIPFPATASSLNTSSVLKINYLKFEKSFLKDSNISFEFIKSLSKKIKVLENFIFSNVMLNATGRVAKFLLDNENNIHKKSEIANIVNITPVSLSRILAALNSKNIIKNQKKEISILDRESLKKLCLT